MEKVQLLGIGNALLDHQIEVPFEFLKTHQLIKGSMSLVGTDTQKQMLREIHNQFGGHQMKKASGGCAANTLAGFSNYGGKGFFVGKVGNDESGKFYKTDLEKAGIRFDLSMSDEDHTGSCLALITPDVELTMLTHLGVAVKLSDNDITTEVIEAAEMIYVEGYLWDSPSARQASIKAMDIAKSKGRKVAFTFSDSFCVSRHKEDFIRYAKSHIDILFCNESEALDATGAKDVHEAFQILRHWSDKVFVTIGPRGALLSDKTKNVQEQIPTWEVKLVDKLGAGDLFASGALFGLSTQKSLKECGYLGCYSATKVIQQISARLDEDLSRQITTALRGPEELAA